MYQDLKEEMRRRYQNSKLMQNYRDNQTKLSHPFQSIGQGIGNAYRKLNGIDKAYSLMNNSYQPSIVGQNVASNVAGNASSIGSSPVASAINSNVGSAAQGASTVSNAANTASTASTAANGMSNLASAGSKAAPVLGLVSAGGNFAKGDNVNGAMDLAKTGAMFIPGVGWAVAGAIQIAQMVRNAMNKKAQENMQKGQEEAAKAQQEAMQNYANQKQGIDELQMENAQNMQAQLDKQNQDTMAQDTTQPQYNFDIPNYQPQETENFSNKITYNETPEALTGTVNQQTPQGYIGSLPDLSQTQSSSTDAMKASILDSLRQKASNGISNLGSFINDFSQGYEDNSTNGFKQGDLWNEAQERMNQPQPSIIPQEEGFSTGVAAPIQKQKGFGQKLGEAVGTGQRVMSNPWTQAAIAGMITRATGGDWADVANNAYKYGTNKATSDYYQKQINPNSKPTVLGNYDYKDYNAQTLNNYRNTMTDINKAKIDAQLDQNFPLASDYYASQLASGQMSIDDYNRIVSDPSYNPNQRISLNTIKTTSNADYQKGNLEARNRQINNSYELGKERNQLGKERNQISWTNAKNSASRNAETARHNGVMEKQGQVKIDDAKAKIKAKLIEKQQQEKEEKLSSGKYVLGTTPDGRSVLVPRAEVKNFRKHGGKI